MSPVSLMFVVHNPAVITLVEYYMPIMDGLELVERIRKCGIDTDVIMITAADGQKKSVR